MKLIFLRMKINGSLAWMFFKGEGEGFEGIWRGKRFGKVREGVPLILKRIINFFLYYVNLYLFL